MKKLCCFFSFSFSLCFSSFSAPLYQSELIFSPESWHNHSSSIVECPGGALLVCWFHGSGERQADDVLIQASRKAPGSDTWSERFTLADTPGYPDCNPTLFIDPTGKLWLFWANILSNQWESAILKYRTSTQYGDTSQPLSWDWQGVVHLTPINFAEDYLSPWPEFKQRFSKEIEAIQAKENRKVEELLDFMESKAEDKLQQRLGWMPRIHPITLSTGRILLPLYTDAFSVGLIAYTDDNGETWQTSHPLVGYGNIQPALVEKKDGTVAAFMRENGLTGRVRYCESPDQGVTWGLVTELDIPNPGSSVDCIRLQNGNWVFVGNDTADGRHQLVALLSDDEGKTWKWKRYLEKAESGGFHYPSLIQAKDETLHISYSHHPRDGEKSIKHAQFNEDWIKAGE